MCQLEVERGFKNSQTLKTEEISSKLRNKSKANCC